MGERALTDDPVAADRRAIIIPALNEAGKIATVLAGARAFGHVFVVDDGSTDATGEVARAEGATVVRHAQPQGYDSALSSGFKAASKAGYEAALTIDADGQLPVDQIPTFFSKLDEGYAIVGGVRPKMPRHSEWLFAALLRGAGSSVRDPFCGMKAYRMRLYRERGFFDSYRSFGTDLLIYAMRQRAPIASLPITVRDRADQSRVGGRLRAEWKILKAVLRGIHRLWLTPARRPAEQTTSGGITLPREPR